MRWPAALEDEYRALMDRKFTAGLDAAEAARFQAIKDEMSAIEMADPVVQRLVRQYEDRTLALKSLRREIQWRLTDAEGAD